MCSAVHGPIRVDLRQARARSQKRARNRDQTWNMRACVAVEPAMATRPPRASRSIESGLPLILAMLVVVVSFTGSLGYSHLRLAAIEQEANSLESTVTPGMERLA